MKFQCKNCGHCCKNFGRSEKGKNGLPLFEWEKEEMERIAKEKGFDLIIQPVDVMFDKRTSSHVCAQYKLINEPCPFLKDNKCSIYEKRPLICRSFPIAESPMLSEGNLSLSNFIHCENFDNERFFTEELGFTEVGVKYNKSKSKVVKQFVDCYGEDIIIYSTMVGELKLLIDVAMKEAIKKRIVKLRKVDNYDYKKTNAIPIFEFLQKINMFDETEKRHLLNKILDYDEVKKTIYTFLAEGERDSVNKE